MNVFTGVFLVEPGYLCMRLIVAAQALTGHNNLSVELDKCSVSNFSLFFWSSNVIATMSAESREGWEWGNSLPFLKKRKFLSFNNFVFLSSCVGTFRYSQDLIQKNKAPMRSVPKLLLKVESLELCSDLRTFKGIAFWCFVRGSFSL